jgi:hypothetical protein
MDNKEILLQKIKTWLQMEDQITLLTRKTKELREAKKELSNELMEVMKTHEIDCFDCNSGKIAYTKNKVRKGISRKFLYETLGKYFGSEEEALKASEYIMENREVEIKETVKLRKKKSMFDK